MSRQKEREAAGAVFAVKTDLVYIHAAQIDPPGAGWLVGPKPKAAQRMRWADAVALAARLRKAFLGVKVVRLRKKARR